MQIICGSDILGYPRLSLVFDVKNDPGQILSLNDHGPSARDVNTHSAVAILIWTYKSTKCRDNAIGLQKNKV